MYCNSCAETVRNDDLVFCKDCGVPLHRKCANKCLECGNYMCNDCYADNRFRCSNCIDQAKNIKTVRRSYIKQYEECPHSLYLQMIEGIVPPMGSYAQLGVITHEQLEKIQKGEVTYEVAKSNIEDECMEWNSQKDLDEYSVIPLNLIEVGKKCIDNAKLLLPNLKGEFKTEYKIEYSIKEKLPTVNCTLDRISFVNNSIHIHDWKTGKPMAGKQLVTDLQPPLYIYAVYKEFGKFPDSFTLHYLAHNKHLTYVRVDDDTYTVKTSRNEYTLKISDALNRTEEILKKIKKHDYTMPEETNWRCKNLCWFGSSGTCDGYSDAEWKKINYERAKQKEKRK